MPRKFIPDFAAPVGVYYYIYVNAAAENRQPKWVLVQPLMEFVTLERAEERVIELQERLGAQYRAIKSNYPMKEEPKKSDRKGIAGGHGRQREWAPRRRREDW